MAERSPDLVKSPNSQDGLTPEAKSKKRKIPIQSIFKYLMFSFTFLLLFIYQDVFRYSEFAKAHGTRYYSFWDFKISLLSALVIGIFRYGIKYGLRDYFDSILDSKYQGEERRLHLPRMSKWFCDVIYYSIATVAGYILIYKGGYMPTWMGGQAECYAQMADYPFHKQVPWLREHYLIQIGNHIFSLIDQFMAKRHEKNYYEIMLHHIMTVGMLMITYQIDLIIPGSIALLLHDPGDIILCVSRFYSDLKGKRMTVLYVIFSSNLVIWIYTRLMVLPTCNVWSMTKGYLTREPEFFSYIKWTFGLQVVMAYVMLSMHFYWVYLMLKRVHSYCYKKKIRTT